MAGMSLRLTDLAEQCHRLEEGAACVPAAIFSCTVGTAGEHADGALEGACAGAHVPYLFFFFSTCHLLFNSD